MNWPEHFPDNCPPSDSQPANDIVYRCTWNAQPEAKDFLSFVEEGRPIPPGADDCEACGLSVFKDIDDILQMWKTIKMFPRKNIVKGELKPEHGNLKNTGNLPSHHTWWKEPNCRPEIFFYKV